MEFENMENKFQVVVYGNLEQYNEVLSKGRCRIFYKGMNRNGSYITDEFADKLISTLPYAPVKGIYNEFTEDYTDHGSERDQGRIYGIVPAEPNVSWETHLDEDGIEREYACVDVLLFTGLYKEASKIVGKPQSMEIYERSIKGEWKIIEGRRAFVFTEGCFLGLQVLGEDVEPCFEGAAFFSLYKSLSDLIEKLDTYEKNLNVPENNEGGKKKMFNFKLSDDEKSSKIFDLLNPNYNEEGQWVVNYMIMDVYDDYIVAYNFEEKCHERIYYTKNDDDDSVALGKKKKCYIVDVTEDEKQALTTIQALNGGNYEKLDENFSLKSEFDSIKTEYEEKISEYKAKISEMEQKNVENTEQIFTLETEAQEFTNKMNEAAETIEALTAERDQLQAFQLEVENNEKLSIIDKYSNKINADTLSEYRENLSQYTATQLDKELAFAYVSSTPSIFSDGGDFEVIPKQGNSHKSDLEVLLDKYTKK